MKEHIIADLRVGDRKKMSRYDFWKVDTKEVVKEVVKKTDTATIK